MDLSALMATDDFGREMRTRVALDSQGGLELSVSYEVEDAHDPLLIPLRPLNGAAFRPVQPLTT